MLFREGFLSENDNFTICSDPNALGFFVKTNIIPEKLIAEFKTTIRDHVSENSSHPLFVMPLHENETLPEIDELDENIKNRICKDFKARSIHVQFPTPSTIEIEDRSKKLKLHLDLEEKVTYDGNRRAVRAKGNRNLSSVCKKVHEQVQSTLTKTYSKNLHYARKKNYHPEIASTILTKRGSVRQPFHADTDIIEGISALAAMRGAFKLIVLKNSVQLLRRIAHIRAQWILSGSPIPPDLEGSNFEAIEAWFDDACYAQLVREGWGTARRLEAFTITIPEGAVILFSTWLLHAGHEFSNGDLQVFNRIHFYFLPYDMGGRYDTVNLHRTKVDQNGLSFSPALHFLPRPVPVPPPVCLPRLFSTIA